MHDNEQTSQYTDQQTQKGCQGITLGNTNDSQVYNVTFGKT